MLYISINDARGIIENDGVCKLVLDLMNGKKIIAIDNNSLPDPGNAQIYFALFSNAQQPNLFSQSVSINNIMLINQMITIMKRGIADTIIIPALIEAISSEMSIADMTVIVASLNKMDLAKDQWCADFGSGSSLLEHMSATVHDMFTKALSEQNWSDAQTAINTFMFLVVQYVHATIQGDAREDNVLEELNDTQIIDKIVSMLDATRPLGHDHLLHFVYSNIFS